MLTDAVALVTGASRGVGRGAVLGLCEAGATVYFTGRTSAAVPPGVAAGSLEQTAAEAAALGGVAIPVGCDHLDDAQTRAVIDRVRAEHGRLDVLVNNVWGGYEYLHRGDHQLAGAPSWERPTSMWDEMFDAGPRAHYVTTALAAPLLMASHRGLVVTVSFFAGEVFGGDVVYTLAKAASTQLAVHLAAELRPHGVTSVALYPGLVRTEGVLAAGDFFDLSNSESPQFIGRVVAALAADPDVARRSGEVLVAAEIAAEYGVVDVDGRRPTSLRTEFFGHPPA